VLSSSGFDMVNRRRFAILQALTRLRQICCHPGLIDKTAENEESAKLTATLELIQELNAEGHKVLLFSQFVSMLKIIRTKLEEMNLPYHWLTGASTDRAGIVRGLPGGRQGQRVPAFAQSRRQRSQSHRRVVCHPL
jgi:SNF2 family DNA or RNA helicase